MDRRRFLTMGATAAAAGATGCVTNPVTGKSEFSLIGPDDEVRMDRTNAPHQISADYGVLLHPAVRSYVESVGQSLVAVCHRPGMPYSFRPVYASYINAYAFPGGTIVASRGILLELENEAQLAGLLGHEIGHVCARHTAKRMTSAIVTQLAVAGIAAAIEAKGHGNTAAVVAGLGAVAGGALLARYSRDDERQADALGMEYMVKAGHNAEGMVGLMDILLRQEKHKPSALEMMFATHPLSRERRDTAAERARTTWAAGAGLPLGRERFMDATAPLRPMKPIVAAVQRGDESMARGNPGEAKPAYAAALAAGPEDYEALLKMAACCIALGRPGEGRPYAQRARAAHPDEPQALHVLGMIALLTRQPDQAHEHFVEYERRLPGNPATVFLDGLALERMGRRQEAARRYLEFLQSGAQGDEANHARHRLIEWGVIQPAAK